MTENIKLTVEVSVNISVPDIYDDDPDISASWELLKLIEDELVVDKQELKRFYSTMKKRRNNGSGR